MNTALVTLRALSALFTSCVYHVAKLGNDLDTGVYKMFSGLCTKEYFAVLDFTLMCRVGNYKL